MKSIKSSSNGHVILLSGGSSTGKSSAVKDLLTYKKPIQFFHLDYDEQIQKLAKSDESIGDAVNYLINNLTEVAQKSSFIMDHWMAPSHEHMARANLLPFKTFYVWLYCSNIDELERREQERIANGDSRGEGIALIGYQSAMKYWRY